MTQSSVSSSGTASTAQVEAGSSRPGADEGQAFSWPRMLLVACAYFAAALAGSLLTLSPGGASVLWPAAGVALAGLLIAGVRYWPGVWLGAMAFHAFGRVVDLPLDIAAAGLIAFGAAVQALLGAHLTHRFVAAPVPFGGGKDVWRFLLLAGPVACLPGATIGVAVLFATGRLPGAEVVSRWLIWATGDVLGVVLIAPVLLLAWNRLRPQWSGSGRRSGLLLIVAAALLATANLGLAELERAQARAEAERRMDDAYDAGLAPVLASIDTLISVKHFFAASETVTRQEFAAFTRYVLLRNPSTLAVDWAPRVSSAQRGGFEAAHSAQLAADFRIFELDDQLRPVRPSSRDEYFPVLFSEPEMNNHDALGLDHGFESRRRRAMMSAAASGGVSTVAPVASRHGGRKAILVFVPVYRNGFDEVAADPQLRREALRGFVVSALDMERFFAPLSEATAARSVGYRVLDVTAGEAESVLADGLTGVAAPAWQRDVSFGGRDLRLQMESTAAPWIAGASLQAHLLHGVSVLAALLIAAAALGALAREASFAASERRLRAAERFNRGTLDALAAHVAVLDASGRIIATNRAWREFAQANGADERAANEGGDYLAECDRARALGHEDAAAVAAAIRSLIEGAGPAPGREYACHGQDEQRWFYCRVTRFDIDGTVFVLVAHEDVTALRLAQLHAWRTQQRFSELCELVPDAILLLDREGVVVQANRRAESMLGFGSGEADGQPFDLLLPADSNPSADWLRGEYLRPSEPGGMRGGHLSLLGLRRDGDRFPAEVSFGPMQSDDGQLMVVSVRDVSARVKAEQDLRRSEARYRSLFESNPHPMWLYDIESLRFLAVNDAAVGHYGYSRAEFLSMSIEQIRPVEDVARLREHLALRSTGRWQRPGTWRHRKKDGTSMVVEVSSNMIEFEGRPAMMVLASDITEREQAQQQLRKLAQAVEQSSESIVITAVDGTIEYVNQAFCRVTGYERGEVIGRNPRILNSGRTPRQTYESMWRALGEGQAWKGQFRNRRKDGSEFVEFAVITPLRQDDGRVSHYVAVKEDITEKQRIGEELDRYRHHLEVVVKERTQELASARQRAEAANEAKSAFLANMSHEIRTPMNGVLGTLELLEYSTLSKHQAELVGTIRESASGLLTIIDDILDFSKIEAGRLELDRAPLSVPDLVEALLRAQVPLASARNVELSVFIQPDMPRIISDEVRVRQVISNLLNNAIKFSGGRPEVRGRVDVRVVVECIDPLRVEFRVTDNGIGMSRQTVASLFKPFTQGEATTTRRFGGTGLGLTICRRLIELLGGAITVESTENVGSTFTVSLPMERVSEASAGAECELAGIDCIVVDDRDLDGARVRAYLEHAGAGVVVMATTAQAAREAALRAAPVVVVQAAARGKRSLAHVLEAFGAAPQARHVLVSRGQRRSTRTRSDGVVTIDGAPLLRRSLIDAVTRASGRAEPAFAHVDPSSRSRPDAESAASLDGVNGPKPQILVAEDDEVNQKVIVQQLALLGHVATIAADGAQALRMWNSGRHALLLTDLHMPVMDGYALMRAIRGSESAKRRRPILALTANALRGEASRAREAGFDEYLTKPLTLGALRAALQRWLPVPAADATPADDGSPGPKDASVDVDVLRGLVGDDPAFVRDLLTDYRASARRLVAAIRSATAAADPDRASKVAHQLKSSSRSVGARRLGELCAGVERAGKTGNLDAVAAELAHLEEEFSVVDAELGVFLEMAPT